MRRLPLFLFIVSLPFSAFQNPHIPAEVEVMVQKKIEEKITAYKKKRSEDCRNKAIEVASEIVDSILIHKIKAIRMDTVNRPVKPVKPIKPEVKTVEDTVPVTPLLPVGEMVKDTVKER